MGTGCAAAAAVVPLQASTLQASTLQADGAAAAAAHCVGGVAEAHATARLAGEPCEQGALQVAAARHQPESGAGVAPAGTPRRV